MLRVATNPRLTPSDQVLKSVADDLGVGDTFHPTLLAIYRNSPTAGVTTR
jgi:cholesterol oxidase